MKFDNTRIWSVAIGAGMLASLMLLPQAKGELVYETPASGEDANRVEERDTMRQALSASQKAQNATEPTQIVSQPSEKEAPAPAILAPAHTPAAAQPQVAPQPVAIVPVVQQQQAQPQVQPLVQQQAQQQAIPVQTQASQAQSSQPEVQNLSKSEMMRRERVREELRNEDMLQERLEELRLKDEKKRAEQLFGQPGTQSAGAVAAPAPLKEENIATPVTERPGNPAVVATSFTPGASQDQLVVSHSATSFLEASPDRTMVSLQPRAGATFMNVSSGNYDVKPRFSAGVAAAFAATDNVSLEAAWQYSEFGLSINSVTDYYTRAMYYGSMYGYTPNFENVALKQHMFDLGLKIHVLSSDSKIRPFIGGGGAYSKSFLNYDQRVQQVMMQYGGAGAYSPDYAMDSFYGTLSTGLDVKLSKNITVGATFKYNLPISSRQTSQLNNFVFGGYNNGYQFVTDAEKQAVGGTLAVSSSYSILGGATFSF